MNKQVDLWAIIVAAGRGSRFDHHGQPKQYRQIAGSTVVQHSIDKLCQALPQLTKIVLVIHPQDNLSRNISDDLSNVQIVRGGEQRSQSVLNGLRALQGDAQTHDWVLVHDAVRPCVRVDDIRQLVQQVLRQGVGGLLAVPARNTLKLGDSNGAISHTIDRSSIWCAQTPQMFPYGRLVQALEHACQTHQPITDDSSAMEQLGDRPLLVIGHHDNIKITYPEDLEIAEQILLAQQSTTMRRATVED